LKSTTIWIGGNSEIEHTLGKSSTGDKKWLSAKEKFPYDENNIAIRFNGKIVQDIAEQALSRKKENNKMNCNH
jgi:hypothetical protein